jgi:short-subunit dehydrogenase
MTRNLDGAVVAVIGASGGLGEHIVHALHELHCQLILVGPHGDRLQAVADRLSGGSREPMVLEADLRSVHCGDHISNTALTAFGRLDGVVNAAGVVGFGTLLETDDVIVEEIFLVNVLGPLWMMKRVTPLLSASKGFVVNISAVVAETPMANMAAYSASKSAMTAADAALARELRRSGVTVCDVRPPHTETGLAQHPICGIAPKLPIGLSPEAVARRVIEAIVAEKTDVPSSEFAGESGP